MDVTTAISELLRSIVGQNAFRKDMPNYKVTAAFGHCFRSIYGTISLTARATLTWFSKERFVEKTLLKTCA